MFKATREIYEALKKDGELKVFVEEHDRSSAVWIQLMLENGGSYRIRFISTSDENDVELRVYALIQVGQGRMPWMLRLVNELNGRYRFAKFSIDEDGGLNVAYDYPTDCVSPASSAREMVVRFAQIIESVYPEVMRALWAN